MSLELRSNTALLLRTPLYPTLANDSLKALVAQMHMANPSGPGHKAKTDAIQSLAVCFHHESKDHFG